jgi:hypothetical protein
MNGPAMRSVGPSSRYTVLAANVSKVLRALTTRDIVPAEQKLLDRAAELLRNVVEGTQFVEQKEARAIANPHESLFTAGHALSALQSLNRASGAANPVTAIFEEFEADLRRLSSGQRLDEPRLDTIRSFFDVLGDAFYRDIANTSVTHRQPHFEKP